MTSKEVKKWHLITVAKARSAVPAAVHVADRDKRRRLRVAYNSIFRRVFDYRDWESVTALQGTLRRPTWEELLAKRTDKFLLSVSRNVFLRHIF